MSVEEDGKKVTGSIDEDEELGTDKYGKVFSSWTTCRDIHNLF
jgi:hypothetical protein